MSVPRDIARIGVDAGHDLRPPEPALRRHERRISEEGAEFTGAAGEGADVLAWVGADVFEEEPSGGVHPAGLVQGARRAFDDVFVHGAVFVGQPQGIRVPADRGEQRVRQVMRWWSLQIHPAPPVPAIQVDVTLYLGHGGHDHRRRHIADRQSCPDPDPRPQPSNADGHDDKEGQHDGEAMGVADEVHGSNEQAERGAAKASAALKVDTWLSRADQTMSAASTSGGKTEVAVWFDTCP